MRNGKRDGAEQRYRCKYCGHTFREPGHHGPERYSFRIYRKLEAASVIRHHPNEKRAHIAERLGIHRSSVTHWLRHQGPADLRLLGVHEIEDGRYFRRTGTRPPDTSFDVGPDDAELYLMACFGELHYWARTLEVLTTAELQVYGSMIRDRSDPIEERHRLLRPIRDYLMGVKPSLFFRLPN